MEVYIINIGLIVFEGLWLLYQVPTKINKKRFCILVSLQWILISGLRGLSIGPDTVSYFNNFERIKTYSWSYVLDFARTQLIMSSDAKAPGYTLLVKVFQIFCKDYQGFLIFVATVFFAGMGCSIYKHSKNPAISFILFSCLFYSFFAITGIRQTIVTSVVVFGGIELIKRKKLILFIVCVLLMSTIHASAICFLPFYWIARIPINKKSLSIYWILMLSAFVFRNRFMLLLQLLTGYDQYVQTEDAHIGTFVYLLILIAIIITAFYKGIVLENEKKCQNSQYIVETIRKNNLTIKQISTNGLFLACIFSSLLLINQNTMRVVQYYSMFLIYILPEIPNIFVKRRDVWIFNTTVFIVLVWLLVRGNPQYFFFWQNV